MRRALLVAGMACALLAGCRTNESPEAQVDDMKIAAQVKEKLAQNIGLATVANVAVNSTNGVVTLSGQVDSDGDRSKAEDTAKGVANVKKVVDNIQVAAK
ncbi:MAG TPA: BON domain-containing protein [Bryobacteraceae bacterium]|nr:BON domain-containing protein [Bryobacteraceae bacterium]